MNPVARGNLAVCDSAAPGAGMGSRVERRSAAGEWLLWFAQGGGPPDF
ncbi:MULTISPECIES: hypothetical protein [unclassified Arthrobacter]|nr:MULTISPECIES: hypothetical protein [unclassified Arthrobacter]